MKITVGESVSFDRSGRHGVAVVIDFDHSDGLCARRVIGTHGLSPSEVRAAVDAIRQQHAALAKRFNSLSNLRQTFRVNGSSYDLTDVSIRPRGTDVELYMRLAAPDGTSIEHCTVFGAVESVPSDNEIVQIVRDEAVRHANRSKVAADHARSVRQVLGVE